jgi:hypothetical protein
MVMGSCKLCLQTNALQDSHLVPAAMYKYLRDPAKKNPNPVVAGRKGTKTTSKQVKDYLLCAVCEDLFNNNGERWMLKQVWNGNRFPLRDRLNVAVPLNTFKGFVTFSGRSAGIETDKLGYFALSVVWRAAVHVWDTPFGGKTKILNLGDAQEPIRKFLHRESNFPNDVVVMATVCTDPVSTRVFYMPSPVSGIPETSFSLLTLGVQFLVFIGSGLHPVIREFCCVKSAARIVFQMDCSQKTFEAFAQLNVFNKLAN